MLMDLYGLQLAWKWYKYHDEASLEICLLHGSRIDSQKIE